MGRPNPRGNHTVMTRCTSSEDLAMIHRRGRKPAHWRMKGVALFRGNDVGSRFTGGISTIVAALAYTLSLVVIHRDHGHPSRIVVAGFTKIAGQNMRGTLSRCMCRIMTSDTGLTSGRVIKRCY